MKHCFLILCALIACTLPAFGQKTMANPFGASLNVQDAGTCSTPGSFIWQTSLSPNANATTVSVSGSFSATLTVRESNNGGSSWTTAGTISSAGTTSYSTNGFTDFCVDVTSYVSGAAGVTIFTGASGGGSSGGGGAPSGPAGGVVTVNGSGGFGTTISSPAGQWQKVGMIMGASAAQQFVAQEPTMISPASPVVLTNVASGVPVCGMYWDTGYASGWATNYAESLDCKNFTPYASNPVVSGLLHATVTKVASTYYMAGANGVSVTGITVVSSASPLFTSPTTTTSVVGLGGVGAWDHSNLGNAIIQRDSSGLWYLTYDGNNGSVWAIGVATCGSSTTPTFPCSKLAANPILTNGTGTITDPRSLRQVSSSLYYMWPQGTPIGASGVTPSDGYFFSTTVSPPSAWTSSSWTMIPANASVLPRSMPDEGVGNVNGQAADFFPFDFAGKCFMPYTATPNGNIAPTQVGPAGFHIDLALGQQPCNIMGAAPAQSLTQPSSGNGLSPFPLLRFSQSTPQALTTVTLLNLGSLTLTPGTWLVQATGQYTNHSLLGSFLQ